MLRKQMQATFSTPAVAQPTNACTKRQAWDLLLRLPGRGQVMPRPAPTRCAACRTNCSLACHYWILRCQQAVAMWLCRWCIQAHCNADAGAFVVTYQVCWQGCAAPVRAESNHRPGEDSLQDTEEEEVGHNCMYGLCEV
jgi:hypothetical protein